MKPRANLASRLAFGLCGLWKASRFRWARHHAQPRCRRTPAPSWSAANLPARRSIRISYIGGGSLAPDISAGDADGSDDTQGLARSRADRRRGEPAELA